MAAPLETLLLQVRCLSLSSTRRLLVRCNSALVRSSPVNPRVLPGQSALLSSHVQTFCTTTTRWAEEAKEESTETTEKKQEDAEESQQEDTSLDEDIERRQKWMEMYNSCLPGYGQVFDGIPYNQLPVIHVFANWNNTHATCTDSTGKILAQTTCGKEGFKNAKKATSVAAEVTGQSIATKALDLGITNVRLVLRGIGPGRQPIVKGVQMGGVNIVSITDGTRFSATGPRPRKARRI
ncbi:28S ribosomal protein S11, mitochondrial-like [Branchiostoma floridae]|uniref:28S ribosomal protein S11, mitochondrial-like n=2 Tax=Branchiostoma floridae TaxID=7739 RepID=A0A9J7KAR5_BRAFL|nr:28S ribosomal protein S11, mitochondrial-like [Branchiostoma floridae]